MNALLNRISVDPNVCFGKPCIKGTRIWVSLLLDGLAQGTTPEEMLREYPQLTMADIHAALAYGAEMSRDRFVDMPMEGLLRMKAGSAESAEYQVFDYRG